MTSRLSRSPLPCEPPHLIVVGRDPARVHVVVDHPNVSGVHLRLDLAAGTITDLQSSAGTYDANARRLPSGQPVPVDAAAAVALGPVRLTVADIVAVVRGARPVGAAEVSRSPASATSAAGAAAQRPPPAASRPTVLGRSRLSPQSGAAVVLGRSPESDIVLPYPQVSARHAEVTRGPDGQLRIVDLGSSNGTYVDGRRLRSGESAALRPQMRVWLGPYALFIEDEDGSIVTSVLRRNDFENANVVEIEALGLGLQVPDRTRKGAQKVLLNDVTFKALPGDLIALMGPSGAGKSTLLTVLNGSLRPTSGEVRVNGENLHAIYDALRGSIGYVPQDDLLHAELTVREAVSFSARARLPPDFSREEVDRRVTKTLTDLGLEHVADTVIGSPTHKILSGGQRKRVNIALELVTDPALLFLDEPTSGLAADDTVALIDLLAVLANRDGKTVIVTIHQPAREEFEKFNVALVLAFGGEPVYFGPTGRAAYEFFAGYRGRPTENPRDMFFQLKSREDDAVASGQLSSRSEARLAAAREWRGEFFRPDNPVYRSMYSGRREPGTAGTARPAQRSRPSRAGQFLLLLTRYATIKVRDVSGLMVMLLQAPLIGGILSAVFSDTPAVPPLWCQNEVLTIERNAGCAASFSQRFLPVQDMKAALFILTVSALWFGVSNAAREIVSETAIYRRERMVNLSVLSYVGSKFVLLAAFSLVQCLVLLGFVYVPLELGAETAAAFLPMFVSMGLTSLCGVALGLLISTVVGSAEAAMALTPIALIPQVVMGGLLVPMTNKDWLDWPMAAMPSRWGFESMVAAERETLREGWDVATCAMGVEFVDLRGRFDCAIAEIASGHRGALGFANWDSGLTHHGALVAMTVLCLAAVVALLRRRDTI
jgi:ABC-type multidrug transport system ATPase subunit